MDICIFIFAFTSFITCIIINKYHIFWDICIIINYKLTTQISISLICPWWKNTKKKKPYNLNNMSIFTIYLFIYKKKSNNSLLPWSSLYFPTNGSAQCLLPSFYTSQGVFGSRSQQFKSEWNWHLDKFKAQQIKAKSAKSGH